MTAVKKKPTTDRLTKRLVPVQLVPMDKVDPSPDNRDAKRNIDSLAASIAEHGQLEPIKVRPKNGRFEIVYGERRWLALKKLKVRHISALVEVLDDAAAQEQRFIENHQRVDPHALEEAEEFERMLALRDAKGRPAHTPDSIAAALGCSPGHVYNRLKLTALAPELRRACYAGKLSTTGAFIIARSIPTELQLEAWKKMTQYAEEECRFDDADLDDDGNLRPRAIQQIIEQEFSTRLDTAPFSLKDATLVPAAGSCSACPNRPANQPQLFSVEERKREHCSDLPCYRRKVDAYVSREKERVLAAGGKVATAEEAKRIFNGGAVLPWNSPWVHLDAINYADPQKRSYRRLLGDLCPETLLVFNCQNKSFLLVSKAASEEVIRKNNLLETKTKAKRKPADAASATLAPDHHDDPDDENLDEDIENSELPADHPDSSARRANTDPSQARLTARMHTEIERRLMAAVTAAAETAAAGDSRFTDLIFSVMLRGGFSDALRELVKRRQLAKGKGESNDQVVTSYVKSLTEPQRRALVLELALTRGGFVYRDEKYSRMLLQAVNAYGIDVEPVERAVADEFAAKALARPGRAAAGIA